MAELKRYNNAGQIVIIPLFKTGSDDFATGSDWTPAPGDVKVSKAGAASANIATLPVYITDIGWKFVFSASEMVTTELYVRISDAATKAIKDDFFIIKTFGNENAGLPFGFPEVNAVSGVVEANVTLLDDSSQSATDLKDFADNCFDPTANTVDAISSESDPMVLSVGDAQSGTADTIVLDAAESVADDFYNGALIVLTDGTGVGQARLILDYVSSTKTAIVGGITDKVSYAWKVNPSSDTRYRIIPFAAFYNTFISDYAGNIRMQSDLQAIDGDDTIDNDFANILRSGVFDDRFISSSVLNFGVIQTATNNTITIAAVGPSTTDDIYNGTIINIINGTGEGQSRLITDFDGSTRIATVDRNWITNPTSGNYEIIGVASGEGIALTAQETRDAMKLAATGGVPATDSVDNKLDDLETQVSNMQTDVTAIDAKTTNLPGDPASETNVDATETKVDAVQTDVTAVKAKTDQLGFTGSNVNADIRAKLSTVPLSTQEKTDVNNEVLDVLTVDVQTELSQGVPPDTDTFGNMIKRLWMGFKNKGTQTATEKAQYDANGVKVTKKVVSATASSYEEQKMTSGA